MITHVNNIRAYQRLKPIRDPKGHDESEANN